MDPFGNKARDAQAHAERMNDANNAFELQKLDKQLEFDKAVAEYLSAERREKYAIAKQRKHEIDKIKLANQRAADEETAKIKELRVNRNYTAKIQTIEADVKKTQIETETDKFIAEENRMKAVECAKQVTERTKLETDAEIEKSRIEYEYKKEAVVQISTMFQMHLQCVLESHKESIKALMAVNDIRKEKYLKTLVEYTQKEKEYLEASEKAKGQQKAIYIEQAEKKGRDIANLVKDDEAADIQLIYKIADINEQQRIVLGNHTKHIPSLADINTPTILATSNVPLISGGDE